MRRKAVRFANGKYNDIQDTENKILQDLEEVNSL